MSISRDGLSPKEQAVFDIITGHRALIATMSDLNMYGDLSQAKIDYTQIDTHYIDQIQDPTHHRPSRSAHFFQKRGSDLPASSKKMNMKTLQVHDHKPGQNRFTKHLGQEYRHTTKTATSLSPTDPRYMESFFCDYNNVGLLWDINTCNIKKEKYVFARDGFTDDCQWFDLNTDEHGTEAEKIAELTRRLQETPLATIASLRAQNDKAVAEKKSITWNEILAGLPKGVVDAVFATQDMRSTRIRAAKLMLHIKEKLNLKDDLPVLIMQPYYAEIDYRGSPRKVPERPGVFRFYSKTERQWDLAAAEADAKVEAAAFEIMTNHRALACTVADEKSLYACLNQTDKIKTSLLPPEPQWMKLSNNTQDIGLWWDINACEQDETPASINALREQNNRAIHEKQVIDHNTILAKIPKGRVDGIFCLSDDIFSRLKALEIMRCIKAKFQLTVNLPICIIQSSTVNNAANNRPTFRSYTEYEQVHDQTIQLWNNVNAPGQLMQHDAFMALRQRQHPKKADEDFVFVNHHDAKEANIEEPAPSRCAFM